jgi:hypothetical protein
MNMQEQYWLEVKEKMRRGKKRDMISIPKELTDRERILCETAYRRGCYQGFFYALEAMKWASLAKCNKFLYKTLFKWRVCEHMGAFVVPPRMMEESK